MTQTTDPRAGLERALGRRLPALDVLSGDQCADLLALLESAPLRDRAKARRELADKIADRPRPVRALVAAALLGWRP